MRIEHLLEFVDLAETLSYTETARNVLVSESALSRHIKALEQDLGVVLFERTSRRVRLSEQGKQLLPHARAIQASWAAYGKELRSSRAEAGTVVTIGTNYYIGDLIAQFLSTHPRITIQQSSQGDTSSALLGLLDGGDCQFVVVTDPERLGEHVASLTLATDSFVAVLPTTHRLARERAIDPSRLAGEHFISFRSGTDGDRRIKAICRTAGFEPEIILSAEVGSSLAQLVRDGLGVTFLHRRSITKMQMPGVACVELSPPVSTTAVLCWDRRRPRTPVEQTFLAWMREHARRNRSSAIG